MSYKTVFQNSEYRCTIYPNRIFKECHQVKTQLVEYHSGIEFVCPRDGCDKIYCKRQSHPDCSASPSEMQFFDKQSGDVGEVARERLHFFKQHVLPTKWVEEHKRPNNYLGGLLPRAISPLPKDPEQLRSRLARVNPGKHPMTYCRKRAEKRQCTSSPKETPISDNKCPRTETSDEVDVGHDPMDITLLPGPSTSTSILERHPEVHFDPQHGSSQPGGLNEHIKMDKDDLMVTEIDKPKNGNEDRLANTKSNVTCDKKTEKSTS